MTDPRIRAAKLDDVPRIVELIHELAEYEKAPELCHATVDAIQEALFGSAPALFAHVATQDGEVVGIAVWFLSFSTWDAAHGIYLEDLYVSPEYRGSGLGAALLKQLAEICVDRNYTRLSWVVLDWNTPSIDFYRSLGATEQSEWLTYRLEGTALARLGS